MSFLGRWTTLPSVYWFAAAEVRARGFGMGILSWRMVLRDVVVWRHAGRGATGRRGPGVVGGIGGAPGTVGAAAQLLMEQRSCTSSSLHGV